MSISRASLVVAINTIKAAQYKGADAGIVMKALEEFTDTLKHIDQLTNEVKSAPVQIPPPLVESTATPKKAKKS